MTIFASALHLSRKDHQTHRIVDPYSVHRVVYSCFEDVRSAEEKSKGVPNGIVFSDEGFNRGSKVIKIISNRAPLSDATHTLDIQTHEIPPTFLQHDVYRFKLVANPVICQKGRDVPLKKEADIRNWLSSRSEVLGFTPTFDFQVLPSLSFKGKDGRDVRLHRVQYDGALRVKDQEAFVRAVQGGVGGAKGFGCGLLQVIPVV